MPAAVRRIDLPRKYFDYLSEADFLSPSERESISGGEWKSNHSMTLQLPDAIAEEFREKFTEQLAAAGFDEDYELTKEGELLEGLIDLFGRVV